MLKFWATKKHTGKQGDEIEHRLKHSECLEAQTQALYMENVNLQPRIEQEEEHFQLLLAGYNTYRNKMGAHREVIAHVEGKTATRRELLEKREIVKKLKEEKEELRIDLENPKGNAVRQGQGDIYNLKMRISEVKETVNKKIACIVKEQEVHIQLKKEVEMQNRRCDAILKHLHCQLNKTQSNKRQWNWDIQQMERKVAQLRKCLGITE
ncbi:coiled-coil domain-containing protein 122-like [Polyodon spathula]|uniref:coiled-coil domain-containing protein 122-like n=1 Tax=Polyodon spathula TaxID=7913 RepID=UPI001B7E18DB|nr:coiled-coil domain-containing protein 122-like [Polyodon spathula]